MILEAIDVNSTVFFIDEKITTIYFLINDEIIENLSYDSDKLYYQFYCSYSMIGLITIKFEVVDKGKIQELDIIILIF